jgi:hypothetical protein
MFYENKIGCEFNSELQIHKKSQNPASNTSIAIWGGVTCHFSEQYIWLVFSSIRVNGAFWGLDISNHVGSVRRLKRAGPQKGV